MRLQRWLLPLAMACFLPAQYVHGQGSASSAPVARMSHLAGTVQVQLQNGTDEATDAALNMPLPQGERILTGENGETEVEFPDGSVLRLTPNSTAVLSRLESSTQIELADGLFYLELRSSDTTAYSVLAGEQVIAPQENSSFRIHVSEGQVETGVLSGAVSVSRPNSYSADLGAGESLRSDPKNPKRYLLSSTLPQEAWDNWNEKLSQHAQDEAALRTGARDSYAGDQGYGWADLDASGTWYSVAGEGTVWQPTGIDAGFDPYGYGSWTYGPGGYTWASAYAWGWLPYRCGRWTHYTGFGWGWLPASGCRSYGGGFGGGLEGGGFPVRNPPNGWRPPNRPVNITRGRTRHPTLPFRPLNETATTGSTPRRNASSGEAAPIRIGGTLAKVIPPVSNGYTPQGGSAVGAALLRDFPVHPETHEPIYGLQTQSPIAIPGRPAEWRRVEPAATQTAGQASAEGRRHEAFRPSEGVVVYGGPVVTPSTETVSGGYWSARPTDPPVNATGAPPVNATGAPPHNATGVPGAGPTNTFRGTGTTRPANPGQEGPPIRVRPPLPPVQVQQQPVYRPPVTQQTPVAPRVTMTAPSAPPQPRSAPAPAVPPSPRALPLTR